jgi:hypothetical protein
VSEGEDAERRAQDDQRGGDRQQPQRGEPRPQREVLDDAGHVVAGRGPAHPREQRRQQRDADDPVGHLEQQARELEGGGAESALALGLVGDAQRDHDADLAHRHVADDPEPEGAGLPQAGVAQTPARAEGDARPSEVGQQHERLDGDPERGAAGEEPDLAGGHVHRLEIARPAGGDEQHPGDDHDHVVEHGRPRGRPEDVP